MTTVARYSFHTTLGSFGRRVNGAILPEMIEGSQQILRARGARRSCLHIETKQQYTRFNLASLLHRKSLNHVNEISMMV